jgi:hypothetical protein
VTRKLSVSFVRFFVRRFNRELKSRRNSIVVYCDDDTRINLGAGRGVCDAPSAWRRKIGQLHLTQPAARVARKGPSGLETA